MKFHVLIIYNVLTLSFVNALAVSCLEPKQEQTIARLPFLDSHCKSILMMKKTKAGS